MIKSFPWHSRGSFVEYPKQDLIEKLALIHYLHNLSEAV